MNLPKAKFRRETLWPFVLAGTITWCSGQPAVLPDMGWFEVDKLGHLIAYGTLATAIMRHPALVRPPLPSGLWRTGWLAVLLASSYGLGDEYRQSFTGIRMFEWADWTADTVGAVLAVALYIHWSGYRRLLETPIFRRHPKAPEEVSSTKGQGSGERDSLVT